MAWQAGKDPAYYSGGGMALWLEMAGLNGRNLVSEFESGFFILMGGRTK